MWIARIKYRHDDCVTMPKVVKHNIVAYASPGNATARGGFIYSTGFLLLIGDESAKKGFIKDLRHDERVTKVEINGDLVVFVEKARPGREVFRSRDIICVKPVFCNPKDGHEYWEIATWDKKFISDFVSRANRFGKAQLLSVKRMALSDVYLLHVAPRLSQKQKEALGLAYKYGYYDVPRKVELAALSKKLGISGQAFSERLRTAERKLLPLLIERSLQ